MSTNPTAPARFDSMAASRMGLSGSVSPTAATHSVSRPALSPTPAIPPKRHYPFIRIIQENNVTGIPWTFRCIDSSPFTISGSIIITNIFSPFAFRDFNVSFSGFFDKASLLGIKLIETLPVSLSFPADHLVAGTTDQVTTGVHRIPFTITVDPMKINLPSSMRHKLASFYYQVRVNILAQHSSTSGFISHMFDQDIALQRISLNEILAEHEPITIEHPELRDPKKFGVQVVLLDPSFAPGDIIKLRISLSSIPSSGIHSIEFELYEFVELLAGAGAGAGTGGANANQHLPRSERAVFRFAHQINSKEKELQLALDIRIPGSDAQTANRPLPTVNAHGLSVSHALAVTCLMNDRTTVPLSKPIPVKILHLERSERERLAQAKIMA
ncbi:uncharacterized protein BJ171DRAFT_121888 [Polychytrium aggregatum]|uniref:uncharacterized protein n=1 Tax=Polychytrium aggregatum TaxID=110093 RepID=UPI0022FE8E2C|nr:uncharacterized protein BJ171DRAFT_121888 [Polychytrium aggregatum]KAI9204261.1 hypothetical protein BJ171DRAFT_121888 [Polychytrium aggregatum]